MHEFTVERASAQQTAQQQMARRQTVPQAAAQAAQAAATREAAATAAMPPSISRISPALLYNRHSHRSALYLLSINWAGVCAHSTPSHVRHVLGGEGHGRLCARATVGCCHFGHLTCTF